VGTLNTTEVELVDPKEQTLRLEGQIIRAAEGLAGKRAGEKVRIAIRPERFNFAAEERKDNVLDCTIENITFLGSIVRVQVALGSQKFYMDTFNNPFLELPAIGSRTQITCSREAVLVLTH
jgi:putative spermidine/putrescine transport system ATP-binding protein